MKNTGSIVIRWLIVLWVIVLFVTLAHAYWVSYPAYEQRFDLCKSLGGADAYYDAKRQECYRKIIIPM